MYVCCSSMTIDGGSGVDSVQLSETGVRDNVAGYHTPEGTQLRGGVPSEVFFRYGQNILF